MPRRRPLPARQQPTRAADLIQRIEAIIEQGVAGPLLQDPPGPLSLPFCTRRRTQADARSPTSVTFPGRTEAEARKFNQILHLLKSAHTALRTGKVLTKRNLYYEKSDLYGSQARVDQLVDDLAVTLGVGRHDLGIVAAGKGIIAGPVKVHLQGSGVVDAAQNLEGSIIPPSNAISVLDLGPARWVLVIEKEATFRTLSRTRYWQTSAAGQGLLVTGKGYPDLATRSLLHQIYSLRPGMPIYALVDYDPDGVNIFRCYKWGSAALEHEEAVRLPSLRWLGIRSCDLHNIPGQFQTASSLLNGVNTTGTPPSSEPAAYSAASLDRLSRLTQRDRKLAVKLLGDLANEGNNDADAAESRMELQTMLMMNVKAEIQALNDDGDVARYLQRKLVAGSH